MLIYSHFHSSWCIVSVNDISWLLFTVNSLTQKNLIFLIAYSWFSAQLQLEAALPAFLKCSLCCCLFLASTASHTDIWVCFSTVQNSDSQFVGSAPYRWHCFVIRVLAVMPSPMANQCSECLYFGYQWCVVNKVIWKDRFSALVLKILYLKCSYLNFILKCLRGGLRWVVAVCYSL